MTRPPKTARVSYGRLEFAKQGVSRWDLRDPYHLAVALSWPQFLLAFIGLELAINLVFAILYAVQPGSIANAAPGSYLDTFFFSMETLATVGYGDMHPATLYGHVISAIEIVTGVLFTAIMTGLLFVRFARPRSRIRFADAIVVPRYRGKPTLMVRVGNGRLNLMSNAAARVDALLAERVESGQLYRRIHELRLIQGRLPVLALTWTMMHVIDESSPLHGYTPERLAAEGVRLFVTIEARDITLAATIHDMRSYDADEILFDMRYADAVSTDDQGRAIADLTRLSLVEPDS
jgi:inward rectifier potassium channel